MIKIQIEFSTLYNKPVIVDVKGIKSGLEWLTREIEQALCFSCDGFLTVNWASVNVPDDLRKRVVIVQSM